MAASAPAVARVVVPAVPISPAEYLRLHNLAASPVTLDRRGWADLHCERCEHTLVPWATKSIADSASDPGVRATLAHLRDGTQWGSLSDRVRRSARDILAGQGEQAAQPAR